MFPPIIYYSVLYFTDLRKQSQRVALFRALNLHADSSASIQWLDASFVDLNSTAGAAFRSLLTLQNASLLFGILNTVMFVSITVRQHTCPTSIQLFNMIAKIIQF